MPPRIRLRPRALCVRASHPASPIGATYASLATATTPAPPIEQTIRSTPPVLRYPPTQPPSHKPPEVRKTQLHRQYQSLLKSSPLILLFQHNNVKAVEWMAIRRELAIALQKLEDELAKQGREGTALAEQVKIQVIQTNIFASALRVVEFFQPEEGTMDHAQPPTDPRTPTSAQVPQTTNVPEDERFTHGLSRRAWEAASNRKLKLELEPLLSGPLAVVAFPTVSPQHLKTVLSILSPSPAFPAPKRRTNPDYHEPAVQSGLQKLMLLGARVEGKVFDTEGTRWVGGIEGGLDGLRAQLVHVLQGVGGGLASALEGASRSLYFTVEGRRMDMEEKEKGDKTE
ncbi:hypothetical protein BU26DRAFT_512616 [Trematosphaeria pertusa]|uniref:Ribosomal protein YmL11, mitochondrial n=1 Tax=Trematosphaeria pertusa TaxID=390896 RepID=A0A6A6IYW3_9PLEO|nr:uncharacterized protein BU26DRAFT_512616 [Trematosphaeria pertusa]KAF2255649.1 hypothetical protein BU26DRAFT_512616 [Trematosphaeria pertusa]